MSYSDQARTLYANCSRARLRRCDRGLRASVLARVAEPALLTLGLFVVVPGVAFGTATPAVGQRAQALPVTETFNYQGPVTQTAVVPPGTAFALVDVVGAHGGYTEGTCCPFIKTAGGDGAGVTGRVGVSPGQVLSLKVGQYGGNGDVNRNPGPGGWGATGNGGRGGGASTRDGAGGGGASSLAIAGQTIVIAGGGGGAGGMGFIDPADNGGAGGSTGSSVDGGLNGKGPGAGKGGGGGANGSPPGGGGGNGSASGGAGGGAGAGAVGGKGGAGGGFGGGGGGGGGGGSSSYTSRLEIPSLARATGDTTNGRITITWIGLPQSLDQTVDVPLSSPGVPFRLHFTEASRPDSFRILSLPEHGHVDNRNLKTGTMTYVPVAGYSGTDSMTFESLTGTTASAPATVTFVIGASTPVCASQTIQVPLNSSGVAVQLHCTFGSAPNSFSILELPQHGHLDNRNLTAGTMTYVPLTGFSGTDSMTFEGISGHVASVPATVRFAVG
jgi:hypothetical protein